MNQNPQNQPAPKKEGNALESIVNIVIKILPILIIVFVGIGATSLLYNFILGIVNSIGYYGSLGSFISGIANGIAALARYCFYAVVTAGIYKIIKK